MFKINNKLGIFLIIFFAHTFSFSQVQQEWMKRFSAGVINKAKYISVDDSGNVIVAGISETNVSNRGEMCVTAYNAQGDSLWTSIFEEPGSFNSDDVNGLVIDDEQNIIITGYTHKPPDRDDDLFITTIKYNHLSGEQMFFERYINPDPDASDRAMDIATYNNNIFVTGNYWGGASYNGGTGWDMVVLSYLSNGTNSIVYRWQDNSSSAGSSIGVDKNGQVYALGYGDTFLRLVTVGGNVLSYNLPDTYWGIAYYPKMVIDSDGNPVIITLFMGNASYMENKLLLLKYTGGNQPAWTQIINPSYSTNSVFYDMAVDSSNNIIIAGGFRLSNGSYKNFIKKFNSSGDSLWTVFPPAVSYKLPCGITVDKQNSIYTTGNLNSMIAIKYDQNGEEVWRTDEGIKFWQGDIAVDNLFNVYVTGERADWPGNYCTVKYSQTISAVTNDLKPLYDFRLFQNYPNPFNPTTTIRFSIPQTGNVKLVIYDILGRKVKTLIDEYKPTGTYEVSFDGSGLAGGVYFYKLRAGNFIQTKKMILMK